MTTKLLIVESPSKIKKIEQIIGDDFKVIASFGHFTELKDLKNIDYETFEATYSLMDEKKQYINNLKKAIKIVHPSNIYLATDNDAEGEAIAYHICSQFNLPVNKTKRIVFNEITEKAILKAVENPKTINMNLVESQQSRQIIDLILGYSISPLLWKSINASKKNPLSAGRCQSIALRLIYENYLDIKNNIHTNYYKTIGYFTKLNIPFNLSHDYTDKLDIENFLVNIGEHNHKIVKIDTKQITKQPPQPLITSSLQQMASNELGLSTKDCMKYAQELYEKSLITYMRTDTKKYSKDFLDTTKKYISENFNITAHHNLDHITNDILGDNPHEAIRPTDLNINKNCNHDIFKELNTKAAKLYNLIWRISVQSCMNSAIFNVLSFEIDTHESDIGFKNSFEKVHYEGWTVLNETKKDNKIYDYLETFKLRNICSIICNRIVGEQNVKNTKMHFSEAGLVKKLEEIGIGRPSTYSSIVEKNQTRNYVSKRDIKGLEIECVNYELIGNELETKTVMKTFGNEKGKLVIEPLGILVMDFLLKNCENIFDYDFSSKMEGFLDDIREGNKSKKDVCCNYYETVSEIVSELGRVKKMEIRVDDNNCFMMGKNGPVIKTIDYDGTLSFKSVREDFDMEKLKNGELTLTDLVEENTIRNLGKYNGDDIFVKKGKFGIYIEWGLNRKALKTNRPLTNISLEEAVELIESNDGDGEKKFIRKLSDNLSIRKGKSNDYIFFKTKVMKKPQFLSLNGFSEDYKNCDIKILKEWIKKIYNLY